jgi:hypothetical protein
MVERALTLLTVTTMSSSRKTLIMKLPEKMEWRSPFLALLSHWTSSCWKWVRSSHLVWSSACAWIWIHYTLHGSFLVYDLSNRIWDQLASYHHSVQNLAGFHGIQCLYCHSASSGSVVGAHLGRDLVETWMQQLGGEGGGGLLVAVLFSCLILGSSRWSSHQSLHYDRVLVQYSDYDNSYRNTVRA